MMKIPQPVLLPQEEGRKPPLPFAQVQTWSWQPSRKTLLIQQRLMQPFFLSLLGFFLCFLHSIFLASYLYCSFAEFFPEMRMLTFPVGFYIPIIFFPNSSCSNVLDLRNLQEQVRKCILLSKLFWPTARKNCSSVR